MIFRLAFRSLAVRPVRTAVLACGFGLGIAVMAALLGVGDVILEQARSPALSGGGDMVVYGAFGMIDNAPYVLSSVRGLAPAATRPGHRSAGVHLQLDRDGMPSNYVAAGEVDDSVVLEHAPDLDIAGSSVRLEGTRYHITLRGLRSLPATAGAPSPLASGELML